MASMVCGALIFGFEIRAKADGENRVTFDDHGAVFEDGAGAVHGDDGAAADDEVGWGFGGLR